MNKYINKSKMNVSSLISQNEVYEVFIVSSSILCKSTLIVYFFKTLYKWVTINLCFIMYMLVSGLDRLLIPTCTPSVPPPRDYRWRSAFILGHSPEKSISTSHPSTSEPAEILFSAITSVYAVKKLCCLTAQQSFCVGVVSSPPVQRHAWG